MPNTIFISYKKFPSPIFVGSTYRLIKKLIKIKSAIVSKAILRMISFFKDFSYKLSQIILYSSLTLVNSYRDSLNIESTDTLVLATTGVLTGLIVIIVIIVPSISGVSLSIGLK